MRRLLILTAIAAALPLSAERIRVVVVVGTPELVASSSTERAAPLRDSVIESLAETVRIHRWGRSGAFVAEIEREELEHLRRDPRIRAVDIDSGGRGALLESLHVVGAHVARAQGLDGNGVTVAVLDTGIDAGNPDFAGRVVAEQCFCDNHDGTGCCPNGLSEQSGPGAAADDNGHGTHVTGIIAGGGRDAPEGIAPRAHIVAVKVLDGQNRFQGLTQIYRALEWIEQNQPTVRVINMSLGTSSLFSPRECGEGPMALGLDPVVQRLRERGVIITASAGNERSTFGTTLPACIEPVMAVGATYDEPGDYQFGCTDIFAGRDQVTCFTNSTESIDLVAPGAMIRSVRRGGGSIGLVGTSMAAPHVAGAIALMLQVNPSLSSAMLEHILKTTGRMVPDRRNDLKFPRLDIAAAVAATPKPPTGPRRRSVR